MGVQARSDIAMQPVGFSNGLLGCTNRIKDAKNFVPPDKGVFYFALEYFVSDMQPDSQTVNEYIIIMIESDTGVTSTFLSDGIILPAHILHLVHEESGGKTVDESGYDKSIGDIIEKHFGINSSNWVEALTEPTLSDSDRILSAFQGVTIITA